MLMPTDWPGQGEKCSKGNGHAERCEPIAGVDPVAVAQGDQGKDDEQLGRDNRLHKAQTSDPESRHLKGEAEDHAGDTEEPDGAMEQVVDQVEPEPVLPGCGRRGTTLGDRRQRGEHACRQSERDHLRPHKSTSNCPVQTAETTKCSAPTGFTYLDNTLRTGSIPRDSSSEALDAREPARTTLVPGCSGERVGSADRVSRVIPLSVDRRPGTHRKAPGEPISTMRCVSWTSSDAGPRGTTLYRALPFVCSKRLTEGWLTEFTW